MPPLHHDPLQLQRTLVPQHVDVPRSPGRKRSLSDEDCGDVDQSGELDGSQPDDVKPRAGKKAKPRSRLTIRQRYEMALRVINKELNGAQAAKELGVSRAWVSAMCQPERLAELKRRVDMGVNLDSNRVRWTPHPELEKKVLQFVLDNRGLPERGNTVGIATADVLAFTREEAERLQIKDFAPNSAWYSRFIKRYSLDQSSRLVEIVLVDYNNTQHARDLIKLLDAYAQEPAGGGKPLTDEVRDNLVGRLRNLGSHACSFLGYMGHQPVSLANCFEHFSTFAALPLLNVHDLYVRGDMRRQGLSQRMLEAVEVEARTRRCCKVNLEVLSENGSARGAYEKFGFKPYELDPVFGTAMMLEKKLDPV